jgi:UPF0755 protein
MKKILISLGIVVLAWVFVHAWYVHALSAVDASQVRTVFKADSGSSAAKIADDLVMQKLIRSSFAFKMYARLNGKTGSLKAGNFIVTSSMDTPEIVDVISGGKSAEEIITIPEGFTVTDIDALLAKKGIIKEGDFLHCAQVCDFSSFTFLPKNPAMAKRGGKVEGYLYPDTYYVTTEDFVAKYFIERLLSTFRRRVVENMAADIKASKRSLGDVVIMASLIEEETRRASERPIVAGILWKRFDQKMGLGVDATTRYVFDKKTAPLTLSDLAVDSPYNLRKYRGLPPGPIASPGLSSIQAALHPKESPYYYYLHGTDGQIHYAVTNDEHNQNRARYLQ